MHMHLVEPPIFFGISSIHIRELVKEFGIPPNYNTGNGTPSTLKTRQITPWLVFTMVFADVAVGLTCQSAGPTCQPPTLSFLSSSLSNAFLCSGTASAALPPQPSSASAHRRRVPALRPQRGHGGGGRRWVAGGSGVVKGAAMAAFAGGYRQRGGRRRQGAT